MKILLVKLKQFYALTRARFKSDLPRNVDELREYALSICELYGFPTTDGYLRMIAVMIQHLSQDTYKVPKRYFKIHIRNALAKESAFHFMKEINAREDEKLKNANGKASGEPVELAGV